MSPALSRWLTPLIRGCSAPELAHALQLQLQPAAPLTQAGTAAPSPVRAARQPARRLQGARA